MTAAQHFALRRTAPLLPATLLTLLSWARNVLGTRRLTLTRLIASQNISQNLPLCQISLSQTSIVQNSSIASQFYPDIQCLIHSSNSELRGISKHVKAYWHAVGHVLPICLNRYPGFHVFNIRHYMGLVFAQEPFACTVVQ